jgi:hypothetical protein
MLDLEGHWLPSHRADPRAVALYRRHYSARQYHNRLRPVRQFMGPGETMVLLTLDCAALFAWQHNTTPRYDQQTGVCCTVFRNESPVQSSTLIREAATLAWQRWLGARLFTYIDPAAVASANPGYCFLQAGWRRVRDAVGRPTRTRRGLLLLECWPEETPDV